jgi:hypothetical protein
MERCTGAYDTIAFVTRYRGLSVLLLGAWVGAGIFTDLAVTQNFRAVDRFLASSQLNGPLNDMERGRERIVLRRNAAEENNWIFQNWERLEFAIGGVLLLLLLVGGKPGKSTLALGLALPAIVAAEHFLLTPRIIDLGRIVGDLPVTDPAARTFWMLHGFYGGLDILKILVGLGLAAILLIRPETEPEMARTVLAQGKLRPEGKLRHG